jgi:hypothetical protein
VNSVAIRRDNGQITVHQITQSGVETDTVTFVTPFADSPFVIDGVLVSLGLSNKVYRRLIVASITPGADLTCKMALFDESPSLVAQI